MAEDAVGRALELLGGVGGPCEDVPALHDGGDRGGDGIGVEVVTQLPARLALREDFGEPRLQPGEVSASGSPSSGTATMSGS